MIVGGGRVGQALADMGAGADLVVRRGEAVPADAPSGPIVVCTRNDDLQAVVDSTPPERRKGAAEGCVWTAHTVGSAAGSLPHLLQSGVSYLAASMPCPGISWAASSCCRWAASCASQAFHLATLP